MKLLLRKKGIEDRLLPAKRRKLRSLISHFSRFPRSSGRRILLSNCAWRVIWPARVCRRRGHWSRFLWRERLSGGDPLRSRGLKPSQNRKGKRLARRNWRRRGGGRVGWLGRRRHRPVRNGAKRGGVRLGVKSDYGIAEEGAKGLAVHSTSLDRVSRRWDLHQLRCAAIVKLRT